MAVASISDKGRVRPINEDGFFAPVQGVPLALVADGMGGHQAGEVASAMAVSSLEQQAKKRAGKELSIKSAVAWVRRANTAIFESAQKSPEARGMGTTLTMLYFMQNRVVLAHVGDSRAYRLRDGELEMLTEDHSLVAELVRIGEITKEQAKDHPYKNIITRALGVEMDVSIDARDFDRRKGDIFLLCTDGLTSYVDDQEIKDVLLSRDSFEDQSKTLLKMALERGGRDNITLILTDGEVEA